MGAFQLSDDLLSGDVHAVRVAGEIDFEVAPAFKRRVSGHIDAGVRQLVVDLSGVQFIDSTAIGVLVGALKRIRAAGGALVVVVGDNDDVRGIFQAVGLENVIPLLGSQADAVAALAVAA